jgi:hypothetical protein
MVAQLASRFPLSPACGPQAPNVQARHLGRMWGCPGVRAPVVGDLGGDGAGLAGHPPLAVPALPALVLAPPGDVGPVCWSPGGADRARSLHVTVGPIRLTTQRVDQARVERC